MYNAWILIIFAMATAFICRVTPFITKNSTLLNNKDGKFYKFLGYSTQGMLGIIVYDSLFDQKDIISLVSNWDFLSTMSIAVLIFIFVFVVKSNRMFLGLILSLLIYLFIVNLGESASGTSPLAARKTQRESLDSLRFH